MKKFLDKYDFLIIGIIIFLYTILSFINLGSFTNPNTFINVNSNEEVLIELANETYLSKIKFFTGEKGKDYELLLSKDNIAYESSYNLKASAFSWGEEKIFESAKFLRIIPQENSSLGEIAFFNNSKEMIKIKKITINNKKVTSLTDEKETIPEQISYLNSSYFDEIYFARTAYEYANGLRAYEWTHPPLGKLIQSIPIKIFHKMAPFYYRLMGNIAGILMVFVMYLFGKKLFKKRIYATTSALLMAFDTFHFAQTRMGTVDSFLVLFIMLAFYFMYNFINKESEIRNLFLSGLFFALATSTKWIGLYAGFALAIIFFIHIIKNKRFSLQLILYGTIFFVIIPLLIYLGTYLIYPNVEWLNNFSIKEIFAQTIRMFNYHASLTETHFFSSPYYTWPISYKPVWYYSSDLNINMHAGITGVGNIIIWWFGIIGFFYLIYTLIKQKEKTAFFLVSAIAFTFLPFVFISRAMFLYHYFAIVPFIMLAVVYLLKTITEKIKNKVIIYTYLVFVVIFFIIYYPAISGIYMPKNYFEYIKIFPTWYL